ncbi:hypothetical protein VFPFJ_00703 [Purpureocillium lilacinum]|uniref:Uncharacterized protein n=1 Tax=Purpureocillium lilacinum TaxID=33203 RepID=A0A179HX39_PURLI|nr:hypothetical protein VFPFJ_00703 [Purpureocillium lilacinum]OAQ94594.1 hypothetical protein VFPFJ_00703 [Purpureocillium lilacinum]
MMAGRATARYLKRVRPGATQWKQAPWHPCPTNRSSASNRVVGGHGTLPWLNDPWMVGAISLGRYRYQGRQATCCVVQPHRPHPPSTPSLPPDSFLATVSTIVTRAATLSNVCPWGQCMSSVDSARAWTRSHNTIVVCRVLDCKFRSRGANTELQGSGEGEKSNS